MLTSIRYLFSFAISIQSAFGQLGENTTAHDLALGSLLGWLPILVLCGIVDRNPVGSDDIRKRLNELVDIVANSLRDPVVIQEFMTTFASPKAPEMRKRVERISEEAEFLMGDFFTGFAGQGRVRWHYGAAQPILSDIENTYLAEHGRNWMQHEAEARTELVLGSSGRGLFWFDFRQLWQITAAVIIVGGCAFGALILSYFTPTVGLGCRSLGYLIFFIVSLTLLVLEFLVWWLSSEEREEARLWRPRTKSVAVRRIESISGNILQRAATWTGRRREAFGRVVIEYVPVVLCVFAGRKRQKKETRMRKRLEARVERWQDYTFREWAERLFFRPMEFFNTCWLIYITMAQTFGSYVTCECQSSIYGWGGGYIDFKIMVQAAPGTVTRYWISGTVVSSLIIGLGMAYVVLEVRRPKAIWGPRFANFLHHQQWCLQSHLSTEDEYDARNGLARTRKFRRYTAFLRYPTNMFVHGVNMVADLVTRCFRRQGYLRQKSLYWTREVTYNAPRRTSRGLSLPEYSPYSRPSAVFPDPLYRLDSQMVPLIVLPQAVMYDPVHSPMPSPGAVTMQRSRSDSARSASSSGWYSPRASAEISAEAYDGPLGISVRPSTPTAVGEPLERATSIPLASPPAMPVPMDRLQIRVQRRERSPSEP